MPDAQRESVIDKMLLRDIAMRYARAIDRRDRELLLSCYHPGAIDHHGAMFHGPIEQYVDWQPEIMAPFAVTAHYVTNTHYEISGDKAEGELYFMAFHRMNEDDKHVWVGGRYLDKYERRGGEWRIAHRSIVWDFVQSHQTAQDDMAFLRTLGDIGTGAGDVSFAALPLLGGTR